MKKIFFSFSLFFCVLISIFAQSKFSTQPHQDSITSIFNDSNSKNNSFFTVGKDGFIIRWTQDGVGEHFQVTNKEIRLACKSPNSNDIAIYETDGGLYNRVTVWDWKTFNKKFSYSFSDAVLSLNYSKKGTYIVVGTAAIGGPVFINSSTGQKVSKLKTNSGIYSYTETANSEKTIMLYSLTGHIAYYNLQNNKLLKQYTTEQGLKNIVIYNKNMLLAGIKNNSIYVINAMTGALIKQIPLKNPVIVSAEESLYFIDGDSKTLSLYNFSVTSDGIKGPLIVKNIKAKDKNNILCGIKSSESLMLGSSNGDLFSCSLEKTDEADSLLSVSGNMYKTISDIAECNNSLFMLSENEVIKANYGNDDVSSVVLQNKMDNIISYKDNLILWSNKKQTDVILLNFETQKVKKLFTSTNAIQRIRVFGDKIIEIEGNKSINSYNFEKNKLEEIYSGNGIQDVLLVNDTSLYIAKTSSTKPETILLYINMLNKETVPVKSNGIVAFSLSNDEQTLNNLFYGINLIEDENKIKTRLFSFNTQTNTFVNILEVPSENGNAFTYTANNKVFTNLGKNQISCINTKSKKQYTLRRSQSLPLKMVSINNSLAVLNYNGSVSWYNSVIPTPLAEWYLSSDSEIVEF